MNNKGSLRKERLFVPRKEQILIMSLGLLVSSLAHSLSVDGLGKDCRTLSGGESASPPQQKALDCTPANQVPDGRIITAQATDNKTTDANTTEARETDAEPAVTQASDSTAGRDDSSAVAPQQSTELFISDIETAESAEGEKMPVSDRDLFILGVSSLSTTDDFDARTYSLSYRNHRRELFWPWQEATTHTLDWGLDVDRSEGEVTPTEFESIHVQGSLGAYLTPGTYVLAQVGHHKLQTDLGDRTITSRHLTAIFGVGHDFGVQLETGRDFIYPDGAVPGGITEQLTALEHSASFRWRPHQRLRILGQGRYRDYDKENDENTSRQTDLNILYGISPEWPWVWAGVGAQRLTYDRQVPSYWSPEEFTAYGLRFDSSFPLGERLSGSAAANLDKLDEDGSTGTGYFLQAGLQYRLYGDLYARLDVTESKSIQRTSTWSADSVFFRLSGPLF